MMWKPVLFTHSRIGTASYVGADTAVFADLEVEIWCHAA